MLVNVVCGLAYTRCVVTRLHQAPRNIMVEKQRIIARKSVGLIRFYLTAAGPRRDYYEILGVSRNATTEEIKKAFIQKAKVMHPDVNKSDPNAQKNFVELTAAYDVLKNPNKRSQYDAMGSSSYGSSGFGSGPSGGGRYGGPSGSYGGPNMGFGQRRQTSRQRSHQQWHEGPPPGFGSYPHNSEDFMRWYSHTFRDAFQDLDEVLKHFGGFHAMASAFGFGGARQEGKRTVGDSSFELPNSFLVEESLQSTDDKISFEILSQSGQHIGTVRERISSDDKGIIVDFSSQGKLLAKARWFRKPDGLEKILIEDANSKRIATVEEQPQGDQSLLSKIINIFAVKPYKIFNGEGALVGALSSRDNIKKHLQFFDVNGMPIVAAKFEASPTYSPRRPNMDSWSVEKRTSHNIDPSVFLLCSVFNTLKRKREGNVIDRAISSLFRRR